MSWRIVVCVLLISCRSEPKKSTVPADILDGKSPQAAPDAAPAPASAPTPPAGSVTPASACARFAALAAEGCGWTQRFPPAFAQTGTCVPSLAKWFAPETPDHDKLQALVSCWSLDCDPAAGCMVNMQKAASPPPARTCGEEGTGPILVDAGVWANRRGANAKRFSDVKTSESEPVETCGIDGEVEWMTKTTCNDGSNPYGSPAAANDSRDAWIGRGGRCNSILDRYSVRCPEATYQLYVDRYVCPKKP